MRKFILRLFQFVLAVSILFTSCYFVCKSVNDYIYRSLYSNHKTLVIGDSHVRFLNEKIIKSSLNLYRGGQSYKESYYKLLYFDGINDFDRVILSTSFHNFAAIAEHKINEDYHSIHSISTITSPYELITTTKSLSAFTKVLFGSFANMKLGLLVDLAQGKIMNGKQCVKCLHSEIDVDVTYHPVSQLKEKQNNKKTNLSTLEKRISHHYFHNGHKNQLSQQSIEFFNRIVEYCDEHSIELILVNMPLHPKYNASIPNFYKIQLKKILADVVTQDHVQYFNFTNEFDGRLNMFLDPDHCTPYGGALISQKLNKELKI